jgi:signal transduction histidine kinase
MPTTRSPEEISPKDEEHRTELLNGVDTVIQTELHFFYNSKEKIDTCMNYTRPRLAITLQPIMQAFADAKRRGLKLRYLTEIKRENISYCKDLMSIGCELRHFDGIKGNFMISESEYAAPAVMLQNEAKIASQILYSNVDELIEQQQYIFDTFWDRAIPAEQRISEIEQNLPIQRTQIIYGRDNAFNAILQAQSNSKKTWDSCVEAEIPFISMGDILKKGYIDAKNRGVRIRYITEITNSNIEICKEVMKIAELRHLDDIRGNFSVTDTEYLSGTNINKSQQDNSASLGQLIYSNTTKLVQHQQFFFDMLWNKAIPAVHKLREIEEGILPVRTRLLETQDEIVSEIIRLNKSANKLSIVSGVAGMRMSYDYYLDTYKELADRYRKSETDPGIRWITNIDKSSLSLVKIFLEYGIQIRHSKNIYPMDFGVSDTEVGLRIEKMEHGIQSQSFLVSTVPVYVNHFNSLFDELWKNGLDAADKIRDIEEGIDLAEIEIIRNPREAIKHAWKIIDSAKEEVSLMFSTTTALRRQIKAGGLQVLRRAALQNKANIRILVPTEENLLETLSEVKSACSLINVRIMEESLKTKITIILVDRKECLIVELKDDTKEDTYSAAGLATYSNSKSIVSSYAAIFENLWKQTEMYEQLKVSEKMQKEFINIAAHELRAPIHPLLLSSGSLEESMPNEERVSIIARNARRLQTLANDILDVTRIESSSLTLRREQVDINNIILCAINEIKTRFVNAKKNVKILYKSLPPRNSDHRDNDNDIIFVEADKMRLSQVITNLLSNALKFTQEGTISITVEKKQEAVADKDKEKDNENNNHNGTSNASGGAVVVGSGSQEQIIVRIKDTGKGIDSEIFPRLFTKFATKSFEGTGLGLFIAKNIVEAHGGKIWAQNNPGSIGATFAFSLPILPHPPSLCPP